MTELQIIERAKMYMEKLANGINPLDNSVIPEDDVVNHVRLSKCFSYVAGVLQQVIENGGTAPQGKEKKPPKARFSLPQEKRGTFRFSQTPIPISEIAKRINELSDAENVCALSYKEIRSWLVDVEMLQSVISGDGKQKVAPTEHGLQLGISVEERMGSQGTYQVIVYGVGAQQFILDHLDAILETAYAKFAMQGTPWLPEHDACLIDLYRKAVPLDEIATTLQRKKGAVRARLKKLGYDR